MPTCVTCQHLFAGRSCPRCGTPLWGNVAGPATAMEAIEGSVARIDRAVPTPGRRDPWKIASILLLAIAMMPFLLMLCAILIAFRIALSMLGFRTGGRGGGLLGEIFAFHLIGSLIRPADPVAVYFYVVSTPSGHVMVRQEGELVDGRVFVGNRVRLLATRRDGVLVLQDGMNHTLGTRLRARRSGWRLFFLVAAAVLAILVIIGGGVS